MKKLIMLLAIALLPAAPAAAQQFEHKPSFWEKKLIVMSAPPGSTIKLDPGGDTYEHVLLVGLAPARSTIALPRNEDAYGLQLLEALAEDRGLAVRLDLGGGAAANGRAAKRRTDRDRDPDD